MGENDRELLELAAKAAGIAIMRCTCSDLKWPFKHDERASGKRGHWNPLTDDGDALRLAHKLQLLVDHSLAGIGIVQVTGARDLHVREDGTDTAATRRAIVRAAARIGKGTAHV